MLAAVRYLLTLLNIFVILVGGEALMWLRDWLIRTGFVDLSTEDPAVLIDVGYRFPKFRGRLARMHAAAMEDRDQVAIDRFAAILRAIMQRLQENDREAEAFLIDWYLSDIQTL